MAIKQGQSIIIVGCGRVGAELALSLYAQQHSVAVVDVNPRAFDRLGPDFRGRTVQGEAFDKDVLQRAGIAEAYGFAAVTASDSANIVAGRIAREIYHVPQVVARVYNPRRAPVYEKLGLQTMTSSSWGAQRIEQLILHPDVQSLVAAGNGEVQLYEIDIPETWAGRTVGEFVPGEGALPVALGRGGRGSLPTRETVLQAHDLLQVSATAEALRAMRQRLHTNGEK